MATHAQRRQRALLGLGAAAAALGFGVAAGGRGEEPALAGPRLQPVALQVPVAPADPGELVISGVRGAAASASLLRRAREGEIAGVLLMGGSIASTGQVRRLTGSLQAAAAAGGQPPLLIMIDQEGGTVRRLQSSYPTRSARAMAGLGVAGVRRQGRSTARDLLDRGVNVDIAPVADVPTTATNFLTTRTFGTTASAVARNACAFAGGLLDGGVVPALKHFPGLGGAGRVNTDDGKVTVRLSRAALEASWRPYRQCGASPGGQPATLTMMSSAAYTALGSAQPAVLTKAAYDAARSAGASGPFITDALEASALTGRARVGPRAVEAGANLVLYTGEDHAATGRSQLRAHLSQTVIDARAAPVRALRAALAPAATP